MIVTLNAKSPQLIVAHANKNTVETKKPDKSAIFCYLKHINV